MFKNYLKIAFRNLAKYKLFSAVNIIGLTVGITIFTFIGLFIKNQLSYDNFHLNADDIYRVVERRENNDASISTVPLTTGSLGSKVLTQVPGIKSSARIVSRSATGRFTVKYGDYKFYSGDHLFVSPTFFDLFDFKIIAGQAKDIFTEPNIVLLTKTESEKLFGNENPIGKTLEVSRIGDSKVVGIIEDPPATSHLQFNIVFSLATLLKFDGWEKWINSLDSKWITTYIRIDEKADINNIEERISRISASMFQQSGITNRSLSLQSLKKIHFGSNEMEFDYLNSNPSQWNYINILALISIIVLFVAIINYVNITIAKSMKRTREVGMRKVLGAHQRDLIYQFLGESIITTALAMILASVIVMLLKNSFNELANLSYTLSDIFSPTNILFLLGISILIGIISGFYPALFVSKIETASILKGEIKLKSDSLLRKGLIVIQFAASVLMIILTLVIQKQLEYVSEKNLGFNEQATVVIDINSGESRNNFKAIKSKLLASSLIKNVTVSSSIPGDWKSITQTDARLSGSGDQSVSSFYTVCIDEDFIPAYEIKLREGRNFSESYGNDSTKIILNGAAVEKLNLQNPVGKRLEFPEDKFIAEVIGIVDNFHFQSLYSEIAPLVLLYRINPIESIDYFSIKTNSNDFASVLDHLKTVHEQFDKVTPFEYHFLDKQLNEKYKADLLMGKLFEIAALIAIIISCLGLLAVASFDTENRTKEIGIRKVLGASVTDISFLLSKEFVKLVLIGIAVAIPISFYGINMWLEDFAYRIDLKLWYFIASAISALMIAVGAILIQIYRTASRNPVESIKYE